MSTFFTSDYHIGHKNILEYCRESFRDLDEMREMFISNHNNVVGPDDTVWMLGDVVMGPRAESLPHLARFNGHKHLILGNHDYPHPCNGEKSVAKWTGEYGQYFESMALSHEMTIGDTDVMLVHFPKSLDHTDEVRFSEYRPDFDGVIIHGHLHCSDISPVPGHIHVGIDADWTDYGVERYHPIPIEAVEAAITERL